MPAAVLDPDQGASREKPPGAHPTVWRLAYLTLQDHTEAADGWCVVCRHPRALWPCEAVGLAQRAMTLAADITQTGGLRPPAQD